ncbi:MAG: cation:proton antiporter [Alphaproteobacteria bacterium]
MAAVHDLPLISTIAVGLSVAFGMGMVCAKLRISPIVGYLLAGILVGPHTPGFAADMQIASELSEIGVVLLMFGVGLHFSLSDFAEVKKIALTGALTRIALITTASAALAKWWWDWSWGSGLVFGLALSVASTVVLLRAMEERNSLQTIKGKISIGWLVVEDLAMIFAMVLIPALAGAGTNGAGGMEAAQGMAFALGKVLLFIVIMMVAGKRILPWILSVVTATGSRELFTLAVFAMAMGIAFAAAKLFGVSFALGAFFAGMMIRESDLNHEVADRALPFQDAFAVLFFVAVGMLFNPMVLVQQPLEILAVLGIIIVAKYVVTMFLLMFSGYPLKTGLMVSAGLAQIGEFSFILLSLAMTLKLLPEAGKDLVLAGAIISIALNPVVFWISGQALKFVGAKPKLSGMFNLREDDLAHLRGDEKRVLKDLVVLVGHGRVGTHVSAHLHVANMDLVVIDYNREKVEKLRLQGYHAIVGDATHPEVLEEAAIRKAVALVVTVPDPFEAARIVEAGRALQPGIKILVRAHNDEESLYFHQQQVDLVATATREIGQRMVDYLNGMRNATPG